MGDSAEVLKGFIPAAEAVEQDKELAELLDKGRLEQWRERLAKIAAHERDEFLAHDEPVIAAEMADSHLRD